MKNWNKPVGYLDIDNINITGVHIERMPYRVTLAVLVCETAAQSHKLKLLIDSNGVKLNVLLRDKKQVVVELEFDNGMQTLEYLTNKTPPEHFDYKWLLEHTVSNLTVGVSENGEVRWHDHWVYLEERI